MCLCESVPACAPVRDLQSVFVHVGVMLASVQCVCVCEMCLHVRQRVVCRTASTCEKDLNALQRLLRKTLT